LHLSTEIDTLSKTFVFFFRILENEQNSRNTLVLIVIYYCHNPS